MSEYHPSSRSVMKPLFALGFVLAVAAMSAVPSQAAQQTDQGQQAKADEVETLRKQVQALKKEVETLKRQLAEERRRAETQQAEAARERARAEANFRQARQAVDRFLAQLIAAPVPLEKGPRMDLLKEALKFYKQVLDKKDGGPATRQEQARALQVLGWIQLQMGNPAEAEKSYRQSIEFAAGLVRDFPNNSAYRRDLAGAYHGLAQLLRATGRTKEANKAAERAKALGDATK